MTKEYAYTARRQPPGAWLRPASSSSAIRAQHVRRGKGFRKVRDKDRRADAISSDEADVIVVTLDTPGQVAACQSGLRKIGRRKLHEEFRMKPTQRLARAVEKTRLRALDVDLDEVDSVDIFLAHKVIKSDGLDRGAKRTDRLSEIHDRREALIVRTRVRVSDLGLSISIGERESNDSNDFFETVAVYILPQPFAHRRHWFEGVDGTCSANPRGHVQRHLTEICADVERHHTGLKEALEHFVKIAIVRTETQDAPIDVIVRR
ncbi:MAG: hypothetical protein WB973_06400 [Thermoanaerobaculia bacterium]